MPGRFTAVVTTDLVLPHRHPAASVHLTRRAAAARQGVQSARWTGARSLAARAAQRKSHSTSAFTRPQRFGDSRLGEGVLAVWQAVTEQSQLTVDSLAVAHVGNRYESKSRP
jgi:hypothetical protein